MDWEAPFYIPPDFSIDVSTDHSEGSAPVEMGPLQEAPGVEDSTAKNNGPVALEEIFLEEIYKNTGQGYGQQEMLFKVLHKKQLEKGQGNIYYLFSCYQDFELTVWLHKSGLSQTQIDKYLKLEYVRTHFIQVNIVLMISSHMLNLLLSQPQPHCATGLRPFLPHRLIRNTKQLCLNMGSYQNQQHSFIATL